MKNRTRFIFFAILGLAFVIIIIGEIYNQQDASHLNPGITSTPYPTYTPLPTHIPDFTPTPIGRVSAGVPIVVDDISIVMNYDSINVFGDYIRIAISMKNTGTHQRVFRYAVNSVILKDDQGNVYNYALAGCDSQDLYLTKQFTFEPGQEVIIQSTDQYSSYWWCTSEGHNLLPYYVGPISLQAHSLIIVFEEFGTFSGVEIEINL